LKEDILQSSRSQGHGFSLSCFSEKTFLKNTKQKATLIIIREFIATKSQKSGDLICG